MASTITIGRQEPGHPVHLEGTGRFTVDVARGPGRCYSLTSAGGPEKAGGHVALRMEVPDSRRSSREFDATGIQADAVRLRREHIRDRRPEHSTGCAEPKSQGSG